MRWSPTFAVLAVLAAASWPCALGRFELVGGDLTLLQLSLYSPRQQSRFATAPGTLTVPIALCDTSQTRNSSVSPEGARLTLEFDNGPHGGIIITKAYVDGWDEIWNSARNSSLIRRVEKTHSNSAKNSSLIRHVEKSDVMNLQADDGTSQVSSTLVSALNSAVHNSGKKLLDQNYTYDDIREVLRSETAKRDKAIPPALGSWFSDAVARTMADALHSLRKEEVESKIGHEVEQPTSTGYLVPLSPKDEANVFQMLHETLSVNRFERRDNATQRHFSHEAQAREALYSASFKKPKLFDWIFCGAIFLLFCASYQGLRSWSKAVLVFTWIIVAAVYAIVVFKRNGAFACMLWINAYIIELVFMIENVLVCNIIIQAYSTPRTANERMLWVVVMVRIAFQLIFYMGLVEVLDFSGRIFKYILGAWILRLAMYVAMNSSRVEFDIMNSRLVHLARAIFGERLALQRDPSGKFFVTKDGKICLSLAGLVVLILVLIDCLLNIDVAFSKSSQMQAFGHSYGIGGERIPYICLSSGMVSSFLMPEAVFITRDLMQQFPGVKYGMSLVLAYIGFQMLLHQVFTPPIWVDLIVFGVVLVLSAVLPWALGLSWGKASQDKVGEHEHVVRRAVPVQ